MQTKLLSDFMFQLQFCDLSAEAIDAAKMCLLDLLGVAIAGSTKDPAAVWKNYYSVSSPPFSANVWAGGFPLSRYREAAALNAAYSHILDMDDVHGSSIAHLGAVTIPAALAIAQKEHCSGKELILALVSGYEVGARIGEAINPSSYWYWHTTGIVGTFSSAIAAAKLLRLNSQQMLYCFGSAGTQSSGLWAFLKDGAMSKSLHTANATLCGIRSAELSLLGLTSAADILESDRGLIKAVAPNYSLEALTRDYGSPYKIETNSFKPYACCRHTHSAGYGISQLISSHSIDPTHISHITDKTYRTAAQLTDNAHPTTPYACKFSLQYCIAAFLVYHNLSDQIFTLSNLQNPLIQDLMQKIQIEIDPTLEKENQENPERWPHWIIITLQDNSTYHIRIDYPLGDFHNPFNWTLAAEKFYSLTEGIIPHSDQKQIESFIQELDLQQDINLLFGPPSQDWRN